MAKIGSLELNPLSRLKAELNKSSKAIANGVCYRLENQV